MQRPGRHVVARHAPSVDAGLAEALAGKLHQGHATILTPGILQLEQGRAVTVQQRAGDRLAARHRLIPAAERHRDVAEGRRLVGGPGQRVEDLPARLIEADAARYQIVGHRPLQPEARGEIVDGGNPFTLGAAGFREQGVSVGRLGLSGLRHGRRRPRCRRAGVRLCGRRRCSLSSRLTGSRCNDGFRRSGRLFGSGLVLHGGVPFGWDGRVGGLDDAVVKVLG